MDPTERVIAAIDGKELGQVPTLSVILDDHPLNQVLGFPRIEPWKIISHPITKFILDRWGMKLGQLVVDPKEIMFRSAEAAIRLGFDACWGYLETAFKIWDSKTLLEVWGIYHNIVNDGHGNGYYMYREPLITSRQAYEAWPYFPDPDDWAHKTYKCFSKAQKKFEDKLCICGEVPTDFYDTIQTSMGFANIAKFIRKDRDLILQFLARLDKIATKCTVAMLDAGLKVILKGDDHGLKTGPQMDPKVFDEIFGPAHTRICKLVHDRGGRILIHSCGDNTKMFDYFIKWGYDGGHAFETTSNVNILHEKKTHGDKFTIVGGMGIDYHLTERSKPEEVAERTIELIGTCAPGGRFLLAPAHSHPDVDISKVKIMLDTVREYGNFKWKELSKSM